MKTNSRVALTFALLLACGAALAQPAATVVTQDDVEKATGLKFRPGTHPMKTQSIFAQEGGNIQVSVDIEPRDASQTVRGWEATIRKMQPDTKVDTIPGVGKDAIYFSARPDSGALSADFDQPRVQLRVAIAGAKDRAQTRQLAVAVAKAVAPKVGK